MILWIKMKYRDMLNSFVPYEWEPSTMEIASRIGLDPKKIIRLDTNTSPIPPVKLLSKIGKRIHKIQINQYPDTSYSALREAISDYTDISMDSIIPTNGADEALDIICKIFLENGYEAIASTPTYSYFRIAVELQGGRYVGIIRNADYSDNIEAILSRINNQTRLIFLCSPNNPTGNLTPIEDIEKICKETDAAVVVDEAYYEFSGKTAASLIEKYDNLIIVRTMSKAFSLAGARIGYILASGKTVRLLNKARPPNSLGVINIELAILALKKRKYMYDLTRLINSEKEKLFRKLSKIDGMIVYPSEANFLLIKFIDPPADKVYEHLLKEGIVVRNLSTIPATKDCLRITIGTKKQNQRLLNALNKIKGE
ncbi:MAG: histidinol-phosphate transaminase [Nitrososphaerota archaeon]